MRRQRTMHEKRALSAPRLLIVEDDVDAADSLAQLAEIWGYCPCLAFNGCEALRLAREFRPHAVIIEPAVVD